MEEHEKLIQKATLSKGIEDVQTIIDLLVKARASISTSKFEI